MSARRKITGASGVPGGRHRLKPEPVRPEDATALMPHVAPDEVPEDVGADATGVSVIRTHKEPKHRGARRFGIALLVVVVLAAIVAAGAFISYQMGLWGDIEVPDVMGKTLAVAQRELEESGFEVQAREEKSDGGYGTVIVMEPGAGEMARHGSAITLTIGLERIVPDVIGMKPDEAKALLAEEGSLVEPRIEYQVSVEAVEDSILSITPEPGSVFRSNEAITLVVARALKVPDVKGMQQAEAVAAIEELGLSTQVEWRESSEPYPTVLETDPLTGTKVEEGAVITIYVANAGPEDRWHIIDYLNSDPATIVEYLDWQNWEFQYADEDDAGLWRELWTSDYAGLLFGREPWLSDMGSVWDYGWSESALAYGAGFDGVRMAFTDLSSDAVDEKTVQKYMDLCGFDNPQDTCSNGDISLPDKRKFDSAGISRVCTYGVTDGYTWAVLLKGANDGAVEVALIAMGDTAAARLSAHGGSVCDLVMFLDAYPDGFDD